MEAGQNGEIASSRKRPSCCCCCCCRGPRGSSFEWAVESHETGRPQSPGMALNECRSTTWPATIPLLRPPSTTTKSSEAVSRFWGFLLFVVVVAVVAASASAASASAVLLVPLPEIRKENGLCSLFFPLSHPQLVFRSIATQNAVVRKETSRPFRAIQF